MSASTSAGSGSVRSIATATVSPDRAPDRRNAFSARAIDAAAPRTYKVGSPCSPFVSLVGNVYTGLSDSVMGCTYLCANTARTGTDTPTYVLGAPCHIVLCTGRPPGSGAGCMHAPDRLNEQFASAY
jgi:hypothetical protein